MTWLTENNNSHGHLWGHHPIHLISNHIPEGDSGNLTDSLKSYKVILSSQATELVRSDDSFLCWVNLGIK